MDAELLANAESSGMSLAFSAAEQQTLSDVADHIDRKVELAALYDEAEDVRVKVALATELRLTEAAITRLVRTIDMCAPEAQLALVQSAHVSRPLPKTICAFRFRHAPASWWW